MLNTQNNELFVEQVSLKKLAQEFGTPLYVYSQEALTSALDKYKQAFANLNPLICYAVKANGNLSILKHFANLGCGFDIVSGGELARIIHAGIKTDNVIFSGVGKTKEEIKAALNANIKCFNVESIPELNRINEVAGSLKKVAPISLRINPNVDAKTHPYISTGLKKNKFGIAYEEALNAYLFAKSLPNLKITGIDCHIGSQLTDVSPLIEACERIMVLVDKLAQNDINLSHIDLGGGVGIRYKDEELPDLTAYAQAVEKIIGNRALKLVLEPGRSLVGNAGVLLTEVQYIKQGESKNFVIVDAAMNDLMRPSLYDAYHDIVPVLQKNIKPINADVVGPICETGDFIGKERSLSVEAGDLLAINSAGAYGSSMSSNYNARPRCAEILVSENTHKIIRKRETMEDLWKNEI